MGGHQKNRVSSTAKHGFRIPHFKRTPWAPHGVRFRVLNFRKSTSTPPSTTQQEGAPCSPNQRLPLQVKNIGNWKDSTIPTVKQPLPIVKKSGLAFPPPTISAAIPSKLSLARKSMQLMEDDNNQKSRSRKVRFSPELVHVRVVELSVAEIRSKRLALFQVREQMAHRMAELTKERLQSKLTAARNIDFEMQQSCGTTSPDPFTSIIAPPAPTSCTPAYQGGYEFRWSDDLDGEMDFSLPLLAPVATCTSPSASYTPYSSTSIAAASQPITHAAQELPSLPASHRAGSCVHFIATKVAA
jgi:hypothetical protein